MAEEWRKTGFVGEDFVEYLSRENTVALREADIYLTCKND